MSTLQQFVISHIAVCAVATPLVALIYLVNPSKKLNRLFALYCFAVDWWSFWTIPAITTADSQVAVWWCRTFLVGVVFIPTLYAHWVVIFLGVERQFRWLTRLNYTASCLFLLCLATPLMVKAASPRLCLLNYTIPGPAFHVHLLHFVMVASVTTWLLLKRWFEVRHGGDVVLKKQLQYIAWSCLIAYVGGTPNYALVYGFEMFPGLTAYGNYGVMLFPAVSAYIIFRHKFLDIQLVIKRTVVFAGLSLAVWGVVGTISFWLPAALLETFHMHVPPVWLNLGSVIVIVLGFNRVRTWLGASTDRYLFQQRYDYRALLRHLTKELLTLVDLRQIVGMTVSTLAETMRLDSCGLWLHEGPGQPFSLAAGRGLAGPQEDLPLQDPLAQHLRSSQVPLVVPARADDVPEAARPGVAALTRLKAHLALPLVLHEDLIGILALGKKKSDERYTQEDLDVLQPLSATLAIAIGNARLFTELARTQAEAAEQQALATTDALTGLLIRRAFFAKAPAVLAQHHAARQPVSLLMLDLDHFKETNDAHGHLVGDTVLQEVATRLSALLRQGDLLGRFGGEEFVLLLPHTARSQAVAIAERLRAQVASQPIRAGEITLTQTLSIGVASAPEDGATLEDLLQHADGALYGAKRGGRTRVVASRGKAGAA